MLQEATKTPTMGTMDSDTIKILLVDDHTILREGLAAGLNAVEFSPPNRPPFMFGAMPDAVPDEPGAPGAPFPGEVP